MDLNAQSNSARVDAPSPGGFPSAFDLPHCVFRSDRRRPFRWFAPRYRVAPTTGYFRASLQDALAPQFHAILAHAAL
jgi:hypothetical protein